MEYTELKSEAINPDLFLYFRRRQVVSQCWRKIDGEWRVQDIAFTEDWNEEHYEKLAACLRNTAGTGGVVFGAFLGEKLKGFASVEPVLFGRNREYLDLSSIHVSEDMRGKGIGKELFRLAQNWAGEHGARKLYISAHSSVETQAFYRSLGCMEATEYSRAHMEKEPCDCQLECETGV